MFLHKGKRQQFIMLHCCITISQSIDILMSMMLFIVPCIFYLIISLFAQLVGHIFTDLPATSVPRLIQLPQYIIITAGEVMFSVTGLEFAYSQVIIILYRWFQHIYYLCAFSILIGSCVSILRELFRVNLNPISPMGGGSMTPLDLFKITAKLPSLRGWSFMTMQ